MHLEVSSDGPANCVFEQDDPLSKVDPDGLDPWQTRHFKRFLEEQDITGVPAWIRTQLEGPANFALSPETAETVKNTYQKLLRLSQMHEAKWRAAEERGDTLAAIWSEEIVKELRVYVEQWEHANNVAKRIQSAQQQMSDNLKDNIEALAADPRTPVLMGAALDFAVWGATIKLVARTEVEAASLALQFGRRAPSVFVANGLETAAGEAVFWSGVRNGAAVATRWVAQNGGSTLETRLAARGIKLPAFEPSNPASVAAWRQASRAFAAGARGNVRVLQTDAVRIHSTWAEVEFPALKANPNVKSITAVNPETGLENLLWAR
jgi:hypothetical protein